MKTQAQTIATVITNLSSSLKDRILMSGAFRLGSKAIGIVEKLNRLEVAEQKFGRRKIDPTTGTPEADTLRIQLEETLAAYGAVMDTGGDRLQVVCSLEAIVSSRETPYVKVLTDDQLALRASLSGQSTHAIQAQQHQTALTKANAFAKVSSAVLGELESALAFAPDWELLDIPAEMWNMADSATEAVKKYRAAVAVGKVWDETDMVLAQADIKDIEAATD
jgi:hypothetical protein